MQPMLNIALRAARKAGDLVARAAEQIDRLKIESKGENDFVTEIDRKAEQEIIYHLQKAYPEHRFLGEESGETGNPDSDYLWIIDPIDGTKAFVRGYPMFSVQIALMHRGELVVGVSCAPCWNGGEGELAWAVKGQGAWLDGERIAVSDIDALAGTTLSLGNLARLAQSPGWAELGRIIPQLHRIRGYADFLHYHLLASGRIDAVVETNVNILDIAALSVIVREAGGCFTELDGSDIGLDTTTVLATNGRLHAAFSGIARGL